jgi:uncharacterized protein with HEPN domain
MPAEGRDPSYLWDMLDAARTVQSIVAGMSQEQFLASRIAQLAVERALEIVGEAARRVSDKFKAEHPEIPWRDMIGLRNVVSHQYDDVRHDVLFNIAVSDVPALIQKLEPLIPPTPEA